jgi:hypothetical protein
MQQMPKYRVHATMLNRYSIEVEAPSKDDAVDKALLTDLGEWNDDTLINADGELDIDYVDDWVPQPAPPWTWYHSSRQRGERRCDTPYRCPATNGLKGQSTQPTP